jgi:hypothetical protein
LSATISRPAEYAEMFALLGISNSKTASQRSAGSVNSVWCVSSGVHGKPLIIKARLKTAEDTITPILPIKI